VRRDGRRDDHGVDVVGLGDGAGLAGRIDPREQPPSRGEPRQRTVAYPGDLAPLDETEVPDVVRAPLAESDHAYADWGGG
jgi:hypothetical protein